MSISLESHCYTYVNLSSFPVSDVLQKKENTIINYYLLNEKWIKITNWVWSNGLLIYTSVLSDYFYRALKPLSLKK